MRISGLGRGELRTKRCDDPQCIVLPKTHLVLSADSNISLNKKHMFNCSYPLFSTFSGLKKALNLHHATKRSFHHFQLFQPFLFSVFSSPFPFSSIPPCSFFHLYPFPLPRGFPCELACTHCSLFTCSCVALPSLSVAHSAALSGVLAAVLAVALFGAAVTGMGAAVTLASVAHPKSDMVRVTVVTACGCLLFSVFGGLVFFMVMGHYAQILGCSVAEVLDLTNVWHVTEEESFFVVFGYLPAAFLDMDSSNLVSALLFALMICLSFSTMLFLLHHLTHCAHVWFNARTTVAKWAVSALMCIMFFFVGLQFCTRQGRYLHSIATENCATLLCGLACGEVVMIMVSFQFKRMVISIRMSTFGNRFTPNGRIVPYQSTFQFLMLIVIPLTSLGFFGYLCVESFKRERSSAGLEWYQMLTFLGMASGVIIGLWGAWRGQSALGSLAQEDPDVCACASRAHVGSSLMLAADASFR